MQQQIGFLQVRVLISLRIVLSLLNSTMPNPLLSRTSKERAPLSVIRRAWQAGLRSIERGARGRCATLRCAGAVLLRACCVLAALGWFLVRLKERRKCVCLLQHNVCVAQECAAAKCIENCATLRTLSRRR